MANPINPNILKLFVGRSPSTISYANNLHILQEDLLIQKIVSGSFYSLNFHTSEIIIHRTPSTIYARTLIYATPSISSKLNLPSYTTKNTVLNIFKYYLIPNYTFNELFYPLFIKENLNIEYFSLTKNYKLNSLNNKNLSKYSKIYPKNNKIKKLNKKIKKLKKKSMIYKRSYSKLFSYPKKKLTYIQNLYNKRFITIKKKTNLLNLKKNQIKNNLVKIENIQNLPKKKTYKLC